MVTDVVGSHGEFEVVLGVLALGVLEVHQQSGVVHQDGQLLLRGTELIHELPHRLQVRQVQLNTHA